MRNLSAHNRLRVVLIAALGFAAIWAILAATPEPSNEPFGSRIREGR